MPYMQEPLNTGITGAPPTANRGPRLEFDMDRMNRFGKDRGVVILWEKSYLCPCRSKITSSPKPSCPLCHGRGIAYMPAKPDTMTIQSQEKGLANIDLGLYDSGTAIGTTTAESLVTFRDRITLPDVMIGHSLLFDVTQRRVENGMWLTYDVKDITFAVTDEGTLIYPETDYTFDEATNLFYPKAHLLGKNVSLNLTSTLRYMVIDLLKESRYQYTNKATAIQSFDNLPKKVLLKREDAWVNPMPFSSDNTELEVTAETAEEVKRTSTMGGFFGGALGE